MGLRHNFEASFDRISFFPEYWDIKDAAAERFQELYNRAPPSEFRPFADNDESQSEFADRYEACLVTVGEFRLRLIIIGKRSEFRWRCTIVQFLESLCCGIFDVPVFREEADSVKGCFEVVTKTHGSSSQLRSIL